MDQENLKQAVGYLLQHKDRFSLSALRQQLHSAGYSPDVVDGALAQVFPDVQKSSPAQPQKEGSAGFFDFAHKRVYRSAGGKIGDFILGVAAVFVIGFLSRIVMGVGASFLRGFLGLDYFASYMIPWAVSLALYIAAIMYLWGRRKFVAIGMLACIIFIVAALALLFVFLILAFRNFY